MKMKKYLLISCIMAVLAIFTIAQLGYAFSAMVNLSQQTDGKDVAKKVEDTVRNEANQEIQGPNILEGGRSTDEIARSVLEGRALDTFRAELVAHEDKGDLIAFLGYIDDYAVGNKIEGLEKRALDNNIVTALTAVGLMQVGGKFLKDYQGVTDNANNAELLANLQALDLIAPVVNNMEGVRNIDSTNKEVAFYSSEYVLKSTEEFKVNVAADIEADRTPVIVLGNATDKEIDNALDQVKLAQGLRDQIKILEQTGLGNKYAVIELSKTINGSVMNSQTALKDKTSVDTMKRSARARTLQ